MLSVIIPSRNEKFLNQTINGLLENAEGEIEIIVNLDGYWPEPVIGDNRVRYIHRGLAQGMRPGINAAVAIARGEYIMKIDAHCMVDKGFDVKLIADHQPNWVVIPRRKRLDADNWCLQDVGKPDVDYEYLSFPDNPGDFGGPGLNGRIWTERALERKDILIDENLSFQGSCWFMRRDYFYELELMDDKNYGPFWNEAQEIGLKALSSGGKVMTNKKTWYAHLHKGKTHGRGYSMDPDWLTTGASYTKLWMTDKAWHKQTIPFADIIEKFMPMPGWPENWRDLISGKAINTLEHITKKYNLDLRGNLPIEIPNVGRDNLGDLFKELGFKQGAEIGVETGAFSVVLCKANPSMRLYAIDAWTAYPGYREHVSQEKLDGFYEKAQGKLKPHGAIVIKGFSADVAQEFRDNSLDFVYIDANHTYDEVLRDIELWSKKVRPGGIVAGHDYRRLKNMPEQKVIEAVNKFMSDYKINPWFLLGRKEKIEGEIRDSSRSWFYVKPQ